MISKKFIISLLIVQCMISEFVFADPGPAEPEAKTISSEVENKMLEEDWLLQAEGKREAS